MVKCVLIESNENERKIIKKLIVNKMMSNKILFKIDEFDYFNDDLKDYIDRDKGNSIYFVNLNLVSGSGLDVIKYIRNIKDDWNTPFIVFAKNEKAYLEIYRSKLYVLDIIVKSENMSNSINENIDICLKMFNFESVYRYTYKNVEYLINHSEINYLQKEGRRTKIVTSNEIYYQNITLNSIRKYLTNDFVLSAKGILINKKNINKIDWNELKVYFKDGSSACVISSTHRSLLEKK